MKKTWNVISVLWSGGMDSTYLIQHLLDKSPNNVVWASYVKINNNKEKIKMELNAIKKITPILKQKYLDRFYYRGISCEFDLKQVTNNLKFYQMPIWISAVVCTTGSNVNEIAIGYVMNDDAISYLNDFKKIVKSFDALSKNKFPKISFPLDKIKKDEIIENMDPSLLKHVVWCECPKIGSGRIRPCKGCDACKRSPILHRKNKAL
jgi:7-cyano-7-deazaguanine synthase in queuosine biosynthesis